ncbi:hypothetical protein [Pectobacterium polaris]|uniref:hypothetical protein n=1 Tax=Pectobacterium polaris TaxID=2042057 RepID=UPI001581636A|nr:hypothetical protein [Pectobacterium polaris]
MDSDIMNVVAQAHPIYSIGRIIYDITYGRTAGLLKKTYSYYQVANYQQMLLSALLATANIALMAALAFVVAPCINAIIVAKLTALPLIATGVTAFGSNLIGLGFGWIIDAISRKFL